jgi:hypothetical protein
MFLLILPSVDSGSGSVPNGTYPLYDYVSYVRVCSSPTATCNPGDPTMIFDDNFNAGGTVLENMTVENLQVQ